MIKKDIIKWIVFGIVGLGIGAGIAEYRSRKKWKQLFIEGSEILKDAPTQIIKKES